MKKSVIFLTSLFAAVLFSTSCQDEIFYSKDIQSITNDPLQIPATVYNYGFSSRSSNNDFVMPNVPNTSEYENFPELVAGWQQEAREYVISTNSSEQLHAVGQTIYVKGTWNIASPWCDKGNTTIYVLPGATLNFTSDFEAGSNITIYNYGKLTTSLQSSLRFGGNEKLKIYSQTAIDQIPYLNIACEFQTNGAVQVKQISFDNSANMYIGCKIEAEESVYFTNTSTFNVGYIKSPSITLDSSAKLVLREGSYVETDYLAINNCQSSQIYAEEGDVSLIKAQKIEVNNAGSGNLKNTFGNVNILCEKWMYGEQVESTKEGLGLNASVKLSEEVNVKTSTSNDECAPTVVNPKDESDDKPSLETIASITNDHVHPISATCIQFNGDKAYVSWHERGKGIHGCIEVVENTPEGLKLLAYAEDPTTDFNHIIVDNNRLLAVGHNNANAIIGEIPLINGTFTQGQKINYTKLKEGGDGNCIIRNGQYLSVASYKGLYTLNPDLSVMKFISTTGSAKHLSIVGGKILELNLTARDKGATSSPAELHLFDANDYTWSKPTVIASDLTITPVDGKNTIALDNDGSMYVCLGHGGVKKYNGTTCVATINEGNAPANGLCVDDKYLYVAFGKGLFIYDKNNLSKPAVLKYTHLGRNKDGKTVSCNYVAVNGNLIYLAYGLDGYDVIRMKK